MPVYNESSGIELFLERLNAVRKDSVDTEVIFVDGGSSDGTGAILKGMGFKVEKSARGRGNQIRKGVEVSQGDIILILHADSFFTQSPFAEINQACETFEMGAFQLNFDDSTFMMKVVAFCSHMRLSFRQIAFGDQGMFMTREFYNQVGGFESIALMEDYDFSIRAKEEIDSIYISETAIYSSARRFMQHGIWKMIFVMQKCQYLYRRGASIEEIAEVYSRSILHNREDCYQDNLDGTGLY